MRKLLAVLVIAIALAACGDDDDEASTSNGESQAAEEGGECPDISGATLADLVEVFGREPDHVSNSGINHEWYFRDDDKVIVIFNTAGGEADGWAWHDGDEFMMEADEPGCPLPQPEEGHPARFNIEDNP